MSLSLSDIKSSSRELPLRLLVVGGDKAGKSTLAASFPNPVFLPIKREEGIDALDVPTFPTITSYDMILDAVRVLYNEKHDRQTVIVDSCSTFEPLVFEHICQEYGTPSITEKPLGYGRGFDVAVEKWAKIMDAFDFLRKETKMTIVFIGHTKTKRFSDPMGDDYDQYLFDIHDKTRQAITRWVDGTLFLKNKTLVQTSDAGFNKKKSIAIGESPYCIYTQKSDAHPGGGRGFWSLLPKEIMPCDFTTLSACVTEAKAQFKTKRQGAQ